MRLTMSSDEKNSTMSTPVIFAQPEGDKKKSSTKKYVLIGLGLLGALALVITAILVGMHIFSKAQMDIVKYSLELSDGRKQNVEADKKQNTVKYHVTDKDHEAWIVADFNTDIRVTKIKSPTETTCYISPLNRSNSVQPDKIVPPNTNTPEPRDSTPLVFSTNGQPVEDISFLNKDAKEMCKGVSTYWMYPSCDNKELNPNNVTKTGVSKRAAPYYVPSYYYYNGYYYPCINGCCKTVCACKISYTYYVSGGRIYCNWVTWSCCSSAPYCVYGAWCAATPGISCTSGYC